MSELQKTSHNSPLALQGIQGGALPAEISDLVDKLFEQMFGANPNLRTRFPSEQALMTTKRQWILGFAENGVNDIEQLREGMRMFRSNCQWLPSLSEFIGWCKGNNYHAYGLPTLDEMPERLALFRAKGKAMTFRSNAEYWLLSGLVRNGRQYLWTVAEEEKASKTALNEMLAKLKNGVTYAAPTTKELPPEVKQCDPAKVAQHIANIKAILGVRK